MTKRVNIALLDPNGNGVLYGPQIVPNDLNLAQDYAHGHVEQATLDFLNSLERRVAGFDISISTGINTAATIAAPGRVYDENGLSFELAANTVLDIEDSNTQPRIDLIYASIQQSVAGATVVRPFVRLRTNDEYEAALPPYPPSQFNEPTELQNIVTVGIRTGTADVSPAPSALQANEVGLYLVKVGKSVTVIRPEDVVDIRNKVPNLTTMAADVRANTFDLVRMNKRVSSLPDEILLLIQGQFGTAGEVRSLQQILADLLNRVDHLSLPEVLRPKIPRWDPDSGRISASGAVQSSQPVVDIELNSEVTFGDQTITLNPRRFYDKSRHARFQQVSGGAASVKHEQLLTLSTIAEIQSDGGGDFVQRASTMPVKRTRAACAARSTRYVEIFGGLATDNLSALGDWYTYDVENDTLTTRTLNGAAIGAADRAFMFSFGNGSQVLLGTGKTGITNPEWFRVVGDTATVVKITGTVPTGNYFFGDLIQPGVIFIVATDQINETAQDPKFWIYDIDTGFTQLGVSGVIPTCRRDYAHGCFYRNNEFVLVEFQPGVPASGKTYVFNITSLTWTLVNIPAPYAGSDTVLRPLSRFRMANVNGRPLLVGGLLSKVSDPDLMRVWQLSVGTYDDPLDPIVRRPVWSFYDTNIPPLQDAAFCSTIASSSEQLTNGRGFLIAGQSGQVDTLNTIYASVQGGIISTVLDDLEAITLADGSTFASFVIPNFTAAWAVAGYVASLEGAFSAGQIKLEISLDDGATYNVVPLDRVFTDGISSSPAVRRARISMYSFKTSKPILYKLNELFDEDGDDVETRMVLRFNSHTDVARGLYLARTGLITLEATIVPSTPDKALLLKVTPTGSTTAPTLKLYINKRKAHVRYRGTAGISPPQIDNDLAVEPSFVSVMGVKSGTLELYDAPLPVFDFDQVIDIAGIVNGDDYLVEVEG